MEPPALTDPPAEEVFECTYSHCNERFSTLKEMKRHKVHADMHYYCKKCDKDFSSDLKHIMHRVITDDKHSGFYLSLLSDSTDLSSYMPRVRLRCSYMHGPILRTGLTAF